MPTTKQQPIGGKWVQVIAFVYTTRAVLNEGLSNNTSTSESETSNQNISLSALATEIRKLILTLKSEALIDEDGTKVNYINVKTSPSYQQYQISIQKLKLIKKEDLFNASSSELKSFYINIYNSLLIHSIVEGILLNEQNTSTWARIHLYAKVSYQISDYYLSLNEIENGILRGNQYSAVPFTWRLFSTTTNDERLKLILPCDARIHFTLNCGAKSCPPIGVYSSDEQALNKQLDLATAGFLSSNIKIINNNRSDSSSGNNSNTPSQNEPSNPNKAVDTKVKPFTRTAELSMIFQWYRTDFGRTDKEVLQWIAQHMGDSDVNKSTLINLFNTESRNDNSTNTNITTDNNVHLSKIIYAPYDFGLNS